MEKTIIQPKYDIKNIDFDKDGKIIATLTYDGKEKECDITVGVHKLIDLYGQQFKLQVEFEKNQTKKSNPKLPKAYKKRLRKARFQNDEPESKR